MLLKEQKTAASDDMKNEIEHLLVKAEGEICEYKEEANKWQSRAKRYELSLGLLVKEGEYESNTNIINTICTLVLNSTKQNNNWKYFFVIETKRCRQEMQYTISLPLCLWFIYFLVSPHKYLHTASLLWP